MQVDLRNATGKEKRAAWAAPPLRARGPGNGLEDDDLEAVSEGEDFDYDADDRAREARGIIDIETDTDSEAVAALSSAKRKKQRDSAAPASIGGAAAGAGHDDDDVQFVSQSNASADKRNALQSLMKRRAAATSPVRNGAKRVHHDTAREIVDRRGLKEGVLIVSYALLARPERLDQLLDLLGRDAFNGCILFDEVRRCPHTAHAGCSH